MGSGLRLSFAALGAMGALGFLPSVAPAASTIAFEGLTTPYVAGESASEFPLGGVAPVPTGAGTWALVVASKVLPIAPDDGVYVYAYQLRRFSATGAVEFTIEDPVHVENGLVAGSRRIDDFAASPDGATLWIVTPAGVERLDASSGASAGIQAGTNGASGVTVGAAGDAYIFSPGSNTLVHLSATGASLPAVTLQMPAGSFGKPAVDPRSGEILVLGVDGGQEYVERFAVSGALVKRFPIANSGLIVVNPVDGTIYVHSGGVDAYTADGAATGTATSGVQRGLTSLSVTADGKRLWAANGSTLERFTLGAVADTPGLVPSPAAIAPPPSVPSGPSTPQARPAAIAAPTLLGTLPTKLSLANVLKKGLKIGVTCRGACSLTGALTISKSTAAHVHLSRQLATGTVNLTRAGPATLTLKFLPKVAKSRNRLPGTTATIDIRGSGAHITRRFRFIR